MKRFLPPLSGLLLLALMLWRLDAAALARTVAQIRWHWFGFALFLTLGNQIVSAGRWAMIARLLGLEMAPGAAVRIYLQGLAMNVVLPGGLIAGDAWRAIQLARLRPTRGDARQSRPPRAYCSTAPAGCGGWSS